MKTKKTMKGAVDNDKENNWICGSDDDDCGSLYRVHRCRTGL